MKKILFLICVCSITLSVSAQYQLEKLWESDSAILKGPESVLFDNNSQKLYVSSMASGKVVQMDTNGKFINENVATNLEANKGSAIYGGLFYTAENTSVAVIDLTNGSIIKHIPIKGAKLLNDLAIDVKGIIYVSDTQTGIIWRIENDKPIEYVKGITGANGLFTIEDDLYFVGSTCFGKVKPNKIKVVIADGFESGLDGLAMIAKDEFIVSNYTGILYYMNTNGENQVLLDTRTDGIMSNDICYDKETSTLYVPSFGTNQIIAYKLIAL